MLSVCPVLQDLPFFLSKSCASQKSESEHENISRQAQPVCLFQQNERTQQTTSSYHQSVSVRDLGTADATAARHIQFQIMNNFTSLNNQELQDLKLIVSRNLAMKKTLTNKDGYTLIWALKSLKLPAAGSQHQFENPTYTL